MQSLDIEALPLEARSDDSARLAALEEDGYVYFPGALCADEVLDLREAMDRLIPIPESFDKHTTVADKGFVNKAINNAFNRDPIFLQHLDRPGVIELAENAHGQDCHIIGMTAWMTGPGRPDQTLHIDYLGVPLAAEILNDPSVKLPIFISTAHFYLDDMFPELGPTTFVPGSHRSGRGPEGDTTWQGAVERSILCKAGDCVLFRSEVWHRGTANRSEQMRYLLQVHYARRMITQKFPPYLNRFQFDESMLARATERQLRLLGDHRPSNYD